MICGEGRATETTSQEISNLCASVASLQAYATGLAVQSSGTNETLELRLYNLEQLNRRAFSLRKVYLNQKIVPIKGLPRP